MTEQRRVIAQVLEASNDHPDVEELYTRSTRRDPNISIATVYRTVKLFEESGIIDRLEFGDGRARYEDAERDHHDHLIDLNSGEVIEFCDPDIEALQEKIAEKLGYRLKGHKLELLRGADQEKLGAAPQAARAPLARMCPDRRAAARGGINRCSGSGRTRSVPPA